LATEGLYPVFHRGTPQPFVSGKFAFGVLNYSLP
jgi:hypothetical protein